MIPQLNARRLLKPLLSAAAVLAVTSTASAQVVSTWNGGGANGSWGTAGNWDTPPDQLNANETVIVLGGTTQTNTNVPGVTPFVLSHLQVAADATNGFRLSGAPLQFNGANTDPVTYPTGIFNNTTRTFFIANEIQVNTAFQFNITANDNFAAEINFFGRLTGNGAVTVTGANSTNMVVASRNNTSYTGLFTVSANTSTQLGAVNALFRQSISIPSTGNSILFAGTTSAAGLNQNGIAIGDVGYNQQIGSINGGGQLLMGVAGATTAASTVLAGYSNTAMNLNGTGTGGSLSSTNPEGHFGKVGTADFTYRSRQDAWVGSLSVRDGVMSMDSSGTSNGVLAGAVANNFTIYGGTNTQLRINNTTGLANTITTGRIGDLLNIRLAGGIFRLDGSGTALNSNQETVGNLVPFVGRGLVIVNANAAQFARLNFAAFDSTTLVRGGQIGFAGRTLGATTVAGSSGVTFASTTAIDNTVIGGILPWSLAEDGYTVPGTLNNAANTQATYNPNTFASIGANGIAPFTSFDASNVLAPAGNTAIPGVVNSLVLQPGANVTVGAAVSSGAILSRGAGVIDGSFTVPGRAYLNTSNGASLAVNAPFTATGLSTSGTVSVAAATLTGASATIPQVVVNIGNLSLGAPVALTGGATNILYNIARGATLTLPTAGLSITGTGVSPATATLRGAGTVVGNLTIGNNAVIGGTDLAGDLGGGQSPGTLAITGNLALNTGSKFRFYITSIHGDTGGSTTNGRYTQAKINATGALDLTNAGVGGVTIEPWSLNLRNSATDGIYDWDNTVEHFFVLGTYGSFTAFDSNKFVVNTGFQNFSTLNGLGFGAFSVITQGNNLVLYFNPVPEPALVGFGVLGLVAVARRFRKA
jgi:hypothetical protein